MRTSLWFKELRFRLFYRLVMKSDLRLMTLGDVCPWTIVPDNLGPRSNVLSAGAGNDISFELELIRTFGCNPVLVDPSPTGVATVERELGQGARLHFLPLALSDHDGVMNFAAPTDGIEGSFRPTREQTATVKFQCKKLGTVMSERHWDHIDLLKMDIEGAEYSVLDQMLQSRCDVRQICVEFHHGPTFDQSRMNTVRAILALRRAGYDLVHRVQWDHTFQRRRI